MRYWFGLKKVINRSYTFLLWGCGAVILWIVLQVFCISFFHIPTDSMEPGLQAGDVIVVNKLIQGARLFNVFSTLEGKESVIYRLPGLGKIERNDVVVFNNPCPKKWKRIELDIMQYYVKRCVALPGDTFRIQHGRYKVDGYKELLGNVRAQDSFMSLVEDGKIKKSGIGFRAYPGDSLLGWTVVDFGPFYIPQVNSVIEMNRTTMLLYKNVIEWEQKEKLSYKKGKVYLGKREIKEYSFLKNYYFVVGDKITNSRDSRFWGLLPEEFIVGKAAFIWRSVNEESHKVRWDRWLKKIV